MKRYVSILLAAMSVLAASCINDKTVTEFKPVELPEFTNLEKTYRIATGSVLEIVPEIVYSDPDALSYEWVIDGVSVSREKNLKWTCEATQSVSAALFIDRAGFESRSVFRFYIEVMAPFERGWFIALDKGGRVVYDFLKETIGSTYTYEEFADFVPTESSAASWKGVREYWSNNTKEYSRMLNLDADPDKCFSFKSDFEVNPMEVSLRKEFIDEQFPEGVSFRDAVFGPYVGYLLGNDSRLYSRLSMKDFYTGRYSQIPVRFDKNEDLQISTLIGGPVGLGFVLAYDKKNERFLQISTGFNNENNSNAGIINTLPDPENFSNLKGQEIIYARLLKDSFDYNVIYLFLVCKDAAGQATISEYKFNIMRSHIDSCEKLYVDLAVDGLGAESRVIAMDNIFGNGSDNVYFTDKSDGRKLLYVTRDLAASVGPVKEYGTFPSEIRFMDQSKKSSSVVHVGVAFADNTFRLINLAGRLASGYVEEPDASGKSSLVYEWKNLGGEVQGVTYKYGKLGNY